MRSYLVPSGPVGVLFLALLASTSFLVACGNGTEDVDFESPVDGSPSVTATPTQRTLTSLDLPVRIAVTLPVFEDFVRQAGGDHAEVFSLVPEGVDPQMYELTEDNIEMLEGVRFFYVNGLGLDDHLQVTIEANRDDRSYLIPFAPNVMSPTQNGVYANEAEDEAHLWLDPDVAAIYVAIIADEFVIYDEVNRAFYDERFQEARTSLKGFAQELAGELETIPDPQRKLVAHSEAVTHMARRFDLDLMATATDGTEDETPEQTIDRLVQVVEDEGLPAIFAEHGYDDSVLRAVASETGAELCVLYTDVAYEPLSQYEDLMRANVDELLRCLNR